MSTRDSTSRRRARDRFAGALATFVLGILVASAEPLPELPPRHPETTPAQDLFRDWPPRELLERSYWLPWTPQTLQRATLFDRPVLLVMASPWSRRSQELMTATLADTVVLQALNDSYVTVLVNPDRRPDLRERYQTGTWPVVAFLLPNGQPLLSQVNEQGVAQPITTSLVEPDRMLFLVNEGDFYYRKWRAELFALGQIWTQREAREEEFEGGELSAASSDALSQWLLGNADRQGGGFGLAPKFVVPALYEYAALRRARQVPALALHARFTLERWLDSPLYDRRGGGVHRLAAAPSWQQLQYEKMLETNVLLMRELLFALGDGPSEALQQGLAGTARFLVEVLGRPGGGFRLGQWADPASADGGGYWRGETEQAPTVDPLVLSGPNALAGSTLIRAGELLGDPALVDSGRAALRLVLERAWVRGRGFDHVIEPEPEALRFLTTQAEVAFGMLDAYQATGEGRYLEAARDAVDFSLHNLLDAEPGLFRDTLPPQVPLGLEVNPRHPVRSNVRLARTMLRLGHLGAGETYREQALTALRALAGDLTAYRVLGAEVGVAVEEAIQAPLSIVIRGAPDDAGARALRRQALAAPWPWTVIGTAPGQGPATAVLSRNGRQETVREPAGMAAAVERLTGAAPGGPR